MDHLNFTVDFLHSCYLG